MTRDGEPEGELPNNVIAFPKPKADKPDLVVSEEAPESADAVVDTAAPQEPAEEPTMTLDAFERAVRAAVQDKLGDEPSSPPRGADELVAQVFSALTGKDAKSALAEVRTRLAEPLNEGESTSRGETSGGASGDADVIDLAAIREARQQQSLEAASKVGHAIKDTLSGFLSTLAQRQGHSGEITLDASFIKQHGPTLLGNLFQSLAASFMQQARQNLSPSTPPPAPTEQAAPTSAEVSLPDPSATAPSESATASAEVDTDQQKPAAAVQVRLDVGSLLSGLFKRLARPTQPPDEPQR